MQQAVEIRVQEISEQIISNRDDPSYDTFLKGMIRAYREFLEAKPDMMEFEEGTDE